MRSTVRGGTARRAASALAFVMAVSFAAPAAANYGADIGQKAMIGFNGILTYPADPVMSTVQPLDEFREMGTGVVTAWPIGLAQGTLLSVWRLTTGIWDLSFFWAPAMQTVSPAVRYSVFPNLEHE